jgi:hypothetical protein
MGAVQEGHRVCVRGSFDLGVVWFPYDSVNTGSKPTMATFDIDRVGLSMVQSTEVVSRSPLDLMIILTSSLVIHGYRFQHTRH